ncbi:hypothetical protein [Thermaerobacter sp. FW80]|uniref:hypothetical protein n=1 Tax=Thermaerobacter sp. FW80 TaxID=2546351 RepID=UPI001A9B549F|nr:hypothetical protein [Thermaerobacter sp. FW80]
MFHALPVAELTQKLARELPGMLQPQGAQGFFTPRMMFSFMLMNVLAVLAYPQVFREVLRRPLGRSVPGAGGMVAAADGGGGPGARAAECGAGPCGPT